MTAGRLAALAAAVVAGCAPRTPARPDVVSRASAAQPPPAPPPALEPPAREGRHLANPRRLTAVGRNGEAYFAPDGARIIFQSIRDGGTYYRMYTMAADGSDQRPVSPGRGKTTCGWFAPTRPRITFASTHLDPHAFVPGRDAPPPKAPGRGYQWDFDPWMDLFEGDLEGGDLRRLTDTPGYDAEASHSPDGRLIVFTSQRDSDLEIYVMDADGGSPRRLTRSPGYDGGPFFSPDGGRVVFRGFRDPKGEAAEIFTVGVDGRDERQLTRYGRVSWAPYYVPPAGRRILFSSNLEGHNFELYLIDASGGGLERVTFNPGFDGLPSFSRDGRRLLWTSKRAGDAEPQVYAADWAD